MRLILDENLPVSLVGYFEPEHQADHELSAQWDFSVGDRHEHFSVEPRAYAGGWCLLHGGAEVANLAAVSEARPWAESTWNGDRCSVTVAASWLRDAPFCRLFLDGVDVRDGQKLEDCRAMAPDPVDKFEKMMENSTLLSPMYWTGSAAIGASLWAVAAFPLGPVIVVPTTVLAFGLCYAVLKAQAAGLTRIAKWHHVDPGLRGVLSFSLVAVPVAALFVVLAIVTRH